MMMNNSYTNFSELHELRTYSVREIRINSCNKKQQS
jgi:hypothetical protein